MPAELQRIRELRHAVTSDEPQVGRNAIVLQIDRSRSPTLTNDDSQSLIIQPVPLSRFQSYSAGQGW